MINLKIRKFIILFVLIISFLFLMLLNNFGNKTPMKISAEDKVELMELLKIEKSSTFLPIQIKRNDLGFGDTTQCYTLKFEISKKEYELNELRYSDIDTTEISLNWKEEKDEETYICYVREWEYNKYRIDLFNKIKELRNKT